MSGRTRSEWWSELVNLADRCQFEIDFSRQPLRIVDYVYGTCDVHGDTFACAWSILDRERFCGKCGHVEGISNYIANKKSIWWPEIVERAQRCGFTIDFSREPLSTRDRLYGTCINNHECSPLVKDLRRGRGFCNECGFMESRRKVSVAARERWWPRLVAKADEHGFVIDFSREPLTPQDQVYGKCVNDHEGSTKVANVLQEGSGFCKQCVARPFDEWWQIILDKAEESGVSIDFDRMPVLQADRVFGKCVEEHSVSVVVDRILQGGGWCGQCKGRNFDRVYLIYKIIDNVSWSKIGIAANDLRVKTHISNGWNVIREWHDLSNEDAKKLEKNVLNMLKDLNVTHLDKVHMPQWGYTETFPSIYLDDVESFIWNELGYTK